MKTRHASQIREGIEAARLPTQERIQWVLDGFFLTPQLTVRAYKRTRRRINEAWLEAWIQRQDQR